ncbi:response regulator [Paenibacillus nanensis]|uniref:Response regulator n=1 Tax=Paenibacillus nanensis TaxID=393251 RepID=A0A3A1VGY0_9BACL|nr:response regulator [Paenibacillus nanensis]RIX59564.1 response regulator [Paenibacillus nanensis]
MLKAVLFDDEHIVIKGLAKLIVWSECGVELVATAQDGLSALEAIRTHKPDIVMTDIRMPGIDGLELIRTIREEAPETACIVFSGYNEFDYVKKAIQLGVIDYLEKPITLDKIREGIGKAVDRIRERSEMTKLKEQRKKDLLEEAALNLLLYGDEAALSAWMEQFGEDARRVSAVTVLAVSDERFRLEDGEFYRTVHIRNGRENLLALFHFEPLRDDWQRQLSHLNGLTVGSGRTYRSLGDAARSYKEALRALRYGKYLEGTGWISFEELGDPHAIQPDVTEKEEELLFDLRLGEKEGFMTKLDELLESFKSSAVDPDVAEIELLRIVLQCADAAKETGGNMAELIPQGYAPQRELRDAQTRGEAAGWLREELERIIDWVVAVRQRSKHSAVEKALRYMEEHYGRDLTQQEVADYVQMNVTYFSLLFKEQMGLSYIKYLTKIRMEKAKELLAEGVPIQTISERVGYYHARHFAEVFKKHTGLTPGQFRTKGIGT